MIADLGAQLRIAVVQDDVPDALLPTRQVDVLRMTVHQRQEHSAGDVRVERSVRDLLRALQQLIHLVDPVIERLEIAPVEHEAVDDRAPGATLPEHVAAGFELRIRLLEADSCQRRIVGQPADAVPILQPRIRTGHFVRQTAQPRFDDLVAALLENKCRRMRDDESRHSLRILGRSQQLGCFLDLPAGFEQPRRLALERPSSSTANICAARAQQEFAEQRVILVAWIGVLAPEREVVALIQALQQLACARKIRQLAHAAHSHLAQQRAHGEHALRLRIERREDLAGEVVEQHLMWRVLRQTLRIIELGLLQQEDEPTRPALRPLTQLLNSDCVRAFAPRQPHQLGNLLDVQSQLVPAQQQELLVEARARPFGRRCGAAEHDGREIAGKRGDPVAQRGVQSALGATS